MNRMHQIHGVGNIYFIVSRKLRVLKNAHFVSDFQLSYKVWSGESFVVIATISSFSIQLQWVFSEYSRFR